MFSSAFMAITGSLLTDVSDISAGFAIFWLFFLTSLYLLWNRLPLTVIRGALWIGLGLYQLHWGSAWLVLPPEEAPVATIAAIVYTPMLLMIFGLMEGQRRGVLVGITVAVFMGVTATFGALRPEMGEVALNDPRLGTLIAVLIALYVFIQNAWSAQQTVLEDRAIEAALLQAKVNTDPLTGLLNNRGLDIAVSGWIAGGARFGVLLVDVDNFHLINEDSGYQTGDIVLKKLSRLLDISVRDTDVVTRRGPDEFLILTHDDEPERLLRFATRLRDIVRESEELQDNPLTVCIGVTAFPQHELFDQTEARANGALKEAKERGTNNVCGSWQAIRPSP